MTKNVVVTLCLGKSIDPSPIKMDALTHPLIRKYAEKINADFILIDTKKVGSSHPIHEKFQIYDILNIYARIIYLDTDIVIKNECPNLFDIVPEEKLGVFFAHDVESQEKTNIITSLFNVEKRKGII